MRAPAPLWAVAVLAMSPIQRLGGYLRAARARCLCNRRFTVLHLRVNCNCAATAASTAALVYLFVTGNPTQQVDKLWKMMRSGMAGGEKVESFDKIFSDVNGNVQHNAYDADVANSYYNLATDFYEYGWGDSFHFGFRKAGEPHSRAILNSQNFVAQKMQVKDMDRVLDMGCGIGGPLRGVVRATGANITGLTINKHQVARAQEITRSLTPWMQQRCHFVVQDYLNVVGMEEGAYDAAFYMESSLHTETRDKTFAQAYKLLKPGGRLVAMEYNLLPGWNASDPEHARLMELHLHGNGAAKTPTIEEDLAFFRTAGFDVVEHFDFMAMGKQLYGDDEVRRAQNINLVSCFLFPAPCIPGGVARLPPATVAQVGSE